MNKNMKLKPFCALLLCLCLAAALIACNGGLAADYSLSHTELELIQGETLPLAVLHAKGASEDFTVDWYSGDPTVASVDANGSVTGVNAGTVTVTAKVTVGKDAISLECLVTVSENKTPLSSVSFAANLYSLGGGQTLDLMGELIYYPANAADKRLVWASSNPAIAAVDGGIVTPISEGAATITATSANNGNVQAICVVHVSAIAVEATGISFPASAYTVARGQMLALTPTITPANATGYSVVWSSSDPEIATVSGGTVTGRAEGAATITARLIGGKGEKTAVCRITVINDAVEVKATRVVLSPSNYNIVEGDYSPHSFHLTVTPANYTELAVWSVSDGTMLAINEQTGAFSLIGTVPEGRDQVAVFVTCTVGSVHDTKVVFISKPATTLQLNTGEITLYTVGPQTAFELLAAITDSDQLPDIAWTSSNESVALIDGNGVVTAVGVGDCVITAVCADRPTLSATCTVHVEEPPYLVVRVGETVALNAAQFPEDVTGWLYDTRYFTIDTATFELTGVRETAGDVLSVVAYSASDILNEVRLEVCVVPAEN